MSGKIADALTDLQGLYDAGADPLAVMQDLLETTHFLTPGEGRAGGARILRTAVRARPSARRNWRPNCRSLR